MSDNEARYECLDCNHINSHDEFCKSKERGVEYLYYTPPPYIVKDGKYFANLEPGYTLSRRLDISPKA